MGLSFALRFVWRAYLIQGLCTGAITAVAMPTLAAKGMDLGDYAELSALGLLPWCLKVAFAPWIDRSCANQFHKYRRFVGASQILTAVALGCVVLGTDMQDSPRSWGLIWFMVNTGLAAQDTATDAAAIQHIAPDHRAGANSAMQLGHALGASLCAGWLLGHVARAQGLSSMWMLLALVLFSSGILEWALGKGPNQGAPAHTPSDEGTSPWSLRALCLAATAMVAQALTATASAGFLFQRLAWTPSEYQNTLHPLVTLCTLLAYALWTRVLAKRSATSIWVVAGLAISTLWLLLGLAAPLWDWGGHALILGYAALEAFATSAWIAALYGVLMNHCQGRSRALRFAVCMALVNLSRVLGTLAAPHCLELLDYAGLWVAIALAHGLWTWMMGRWLTRPCETA